jgi:hypothetical protein
MSSLETQYKLYILNNPATAHWSYEEWLKWHSNEIAKAIRNINPVVSDDFQIGPDGAYEATEEWELYQQYQDEFVGYEDVPGYSWFINELKTNEKFRNKYGKSNT